MSVHESLAPLPAASPAAGLPDIAPGQIWFIEVPATGEAPPAVRRALDDANVVIYDRSLGDVVAQSLPLGAYAEPVPATPDGLTRCVRFARDGWSVARLVAAGAPQRQRTRQVQDLVDELAAERVPGRLRVAIAVEQPGRADRRFDARFDDLTSIVAAHPTDTRLAVMIGAFAGNVVPLHAVASNGLAG